MTQPQLIAPFKTGLDQDPADWLAPVDSFRELNNFHIRHGRVEKRGGVRVWGYMVHNPATTITNITQANPGVVSATAHGLSNGQQVLISNVSGMTEVNGNIYTVANANPNDFELSGVDTSGFTMYSSGGRVALYAADRIMGLYRYILSDNTKRLLAFDTTRAAVYNAGTDVFDPLDAVDIMSGSDTDYIWAENWQSTNGTNRLYFTNGKQWDGNSPGGLDGIRYYDPAVSTTVTTAFRPNLNAGASRVLYGCKLIFAIRQRLVCLHTFELNSTVITHPQRARWCQAQDPSVWEDDSPGQGGFVDAPTGEQIVSARALQDVIIVFFTNSVWTLRPVSDPALPFRWDKINDFRACDGKMASAGYDRYVVALGVRGITATDGVETRRIDDRIQNFASDDINVEEFGKVYCQRDYNNRRFWTLYPDAGSVSDESTKALIYEDESSAFSEYEINMNVLGYGNAGYDFAFEDFTAANNLDYAFEDFSNDEDFLSFFWQDNSEAFIGGDINGIVYYMSTTGTDNGVAISCDFITNAWNPYQQEGSEAQLNYVDILFNTDPTTQVDIDFYKDSETTPYITQTTDLLPPLGFIATISNVTQANPAQVTANNHGLLTGDVIYIYGVQGMVEIYGEFTVTRVDANNITLDGEDSTGYDAYTTGGQIVKKEYYRTKVWKRIIAGGIGNQHRMGLRHSGANQFITIEGFKPSFRKRGRRTIN